MSVSNSTNRNSFVATCQHSLIVLNVQCWHAHHFKETTFCQVSYFSVLLDENQGNIYSRGVRNFACTFQISDLCVFLTKSKKRNMWSSHLCVRVAMPDLIPGSWNEELLRLQHFLRLVSWMRSILPFNCDVLCEKGCMKIFLSSTWQCFLRLYNNNVRGSYITEKYSDRLMTSYVDQIVPITSHYYCLMKS